MQTCGKASVICNVCITRVDISLTAKMLIKYITRQYVVSPFYRQNIILVCVVTTTMTQQGIIKCIHKLLYISSKISDMTVYCS